MAAASPAAGDWKPAHFLTGGTSSKEARQFLQTVEQPRAYKPVDVRPLVERALARFDDLEPLRGSAPALP